MTTTLRDRAVRRALVAVQEAASSAAITELVRSSTDELLELVPAIVAYYADGTAALAADYYDDLRDAADASRTFTAEPIVEIDSAKLRAATAWAAQPLTLPEPDNLLAQARLAEVVSLRTAEPFRDTITVNQERDPASVGWRRHVSADGCKFCRMLADRGAVYRQGTVRFAAHGNCSCTASPVFDGEDGEEASVIQYVASKRDRTRAEQTALRAYLNANY